MLFRQACFVKSFTQRDGKRWRAIDAGKLSAVPEGRL
jgi:hypothetical protein